MITIDGSFGEGGGQILRSSLALSMMTGKPFKIEKIRAGRQKPGLLRQHLTAVKAATEIGQAEVSGDTLGSKELVFRPGKMQSGSYSFAIGTAGSATLVLQTVLPALLTTTEKTELTLEGGTHNPAAPPFPFLEKSFLPLLRRMGANVTVELERPGFFPVGGGKFTAVIEPTGMLNRLDLCERGTIHEQRATALVAMLPTDIADRELSLIARRLEWKNPVLKTENVTTSRGPGNVVFIEVESEHLTEVFTAFGEKGKRAELVAEEALKEAKQYVRSEAPVGEYLADQLLLPLAVAGGGSFVTSVLSEHTTTNIEVIRRFLAVHITVTELGKRSWKIEVAS
ncbi:MAG: RNA 3'-terminal phosphate cyclase [Blastocatellia bacterium]|nr:RNA 3'-terminal phosphate cyclase [Blastocatellia bacterium]